MPKYYRNNQPPPIPHIPPETQLFLGTSFRGRLLHWGIRDTENTSTTGLVIACLPKRFDLFPQPKLPAHLQAMGLEVLKLPRCSRCRRIRSLPTGTKPVYPQREPRTPLTQRLADSIAEVLPPTPEPKPEPEPVPEPAPTAPVRHRPARTKTITRKKGPTS